MKFRILSPLHLLFIALLAPAPALAELGEAPMPQIMPKQETGPTLKETEKWIVEKIGESNNYEFKDSDGEKHRWENSVSFSGCTANYSNQENHYVKSEGIFFDSYYWLYERPSRFTANLAELDISRIESGESKSNGEHYYYITIPTIADQKKIIVKPQRLDYQDDFVENVSKIPFLYIRDGSLAERLKNALQHAVNLCREEATKKEQSKSVTKEPF